ncbi:hypothetical protein PISMIDRAFT_441412 [Pisolithus microcarpus 441]|uniref:Unplaced genomic scaffold scaffold_4, whole genome shotgun sequence n=1 Tax=Pisolithus microcarpus 441 TaxID=765257 RepID=A0A0C9YXC4_9AGAM|nr:hypothetical protein PISMIDRAFT_441412 [Pisolithus microcarpus 441]
MFTLAHHISQIQSPREARVVRYESRSRTRAVRTWSSVHPHWPITFCLRGPRGTCHSEVVSPLPRTCRGYVLKGLPFSQTVRHIRIHLQQDSHC